MSNLFSPPSPAPLFAVTVESVCQPGECCLVLKTGWQGQGLGEVGKEEPERQGQVTGRGANARQAHGPRVPARRLRPAPDLPGAGLRSVWREEGREVTSV